MQNAKLRMVRGRHFPARARFLVHRSAPIVYPRGMADAGELERQYNNRKAVPEHGEIAAQWDRDAAAYRAVAQGAEYDIAYANSERARFDFFPGEGGADGAPLLVYIHGGFWRSRDRKTFSHIAAAFNPRGLSVAVTSYDHCPHVSIMDIIGQMRALLKTLWAKTGQHPVVVGNSAGAHLAGAMFATDWSAVDGVPDDLVRCGYGLSGIYDLQPCCEISVNEDLKLTKESAIAASPVFWPLPAHARDYVAAVGALELGEFKRQSRGLADTWSRAGARAEYTEIADANHFTIVNALTAPRSPMAGRVARMAEMAARG